MRAINNTEILLGTNEIPISVYSAIESETSFKQISVCCNSPVNYKKVCSSCLKELECIKKAIDIGTGFKDVDTNSLKVENAGLKILGVLDEDSEENGVFKNGDVYFFGVRKEKIKAKTERNALKYAYLKESLKESKKFLIGLIALRGKEKPIILKPYFNGFLGVGIYHLEQIRNISDIESVEATTDKNMVKQMALAFSQKERVNVKDIKNKRNELIEKILLSNEQISKVEEKKEEVNPIELCNF